MKFTEARNFSQDLAVVKSMESDKWGYINTKGEIVISLKYDKAYDFAEDVAIVYENYKKRCVINMKGNIIFEFKNYLPDRLKYSDGLLSVLDFHGKKGYIDEKENIVIELPTEQN